MMPTASQPPLSTAMPPMNTAGPSINPPFKQPSSNTFGSSNPAFNNNNNNAASSPADSLTKQLYYYNMLFNTMVDKTTPYSLYRWVGTSILLCLFILRVVTVHAWYLVTYALGIYLLNMFLAFLSPKFDPSIEMESLGNDDGVDGGGDDMPALPTRHDEEFKPFIRRLPEFKFWYSSTRAIVLAMFATLFEFTDVPVFWPILLIYFLMLTFLTLKRQIRHMFKYNYIPFDFGKKKYAGS